MQTFRVEKQIKFTSWRTETFYVEAESIAYVKKNLEKLKEQADFDAEIIYDTILDCCLDMDEEIWLIDDEEIL